MSWLFVLALYFVLATTDRLLLRSLGKKIPQYNKLVNAFSYIVFQLPVGFLVGYLHGFDLAVGWENALFLIVGTIMFPVGRVITFRANKTVNAGLYSVLSNLAPVLTIILASFLLHDVLSSQQLIGAFVIIFSALLITIPSYDQGSKSTRFGIVLALISIVILATITVYESWMLERMGIGTYLILGWGMQAFWMAVFAWPERVHLKKMIKQGYAVPASVLGFVKSVKGVVFLAALGLSGNAALFSSYVSILPILVVLAAYVILKEKEAIGLKLVSAAIGTIGLVILSTAG